MFEQNRTLSLYIHEHGNNLQEPRSKNPAANKICGTSDKFLGEGIAMQSYAHTLFLRHVQRCKLDASWRNKSSIQHSSSLARWTCVTDWFQFLRFLAFASFEVDEHDLDEKHHLQVHPPRRVGFRLLCRYFLRDWGMYASSTAKAVCRIYPELGVCCFKFRTIGFHFCSSSFWTWSRILAGALTCSVLLKNLSTSGSN